ncbi:hypothetical protein [Streptomyces phaeochromogenes]
MNDKTRLRIRHTFDGLSADGRVLTDIDRGLMDAFERLMHGLPELTDGKITIVNLCTEAGVSCASCYRSPVAQAVKEILEAPQTRRPEPPGPAVSPVAVLQQPWLRNSTTAPSCERQLPYCCPAVHLCQALLSLWCYGRNRNRTTDQCLLQPT